METPLTMGLGAACFLGTFAYAGWSMRESGRLRGAIAEQRRELRDAHQAIRFLRRFAQFGFEAPDGHDEAEGEDSSTWRADGGPDEWR